MSSRAIEPSSSATEIGLSEPKNFNSLEALTAPLSVETVAGVQGLSSDESAGEATLTAAADTTVNTEAEAPSSAPLNPAEVAAGEEVAKSAGEAATLKEDEKKETENAPVDKASASGAKINEDKDEKGPDGLTPEERKKVAELKRRDAEVKAHEQAHAAAGGPYASAPRFRFTRGPDGKFYAVAGEVSIDTSAIPGNPQATIRKMQQVKRAALAPHEPSAQDRRVAAEAERKIIQARQEIREAEDAEVKQAQSKQKQREAEAQGLSRSITPEQAPTFDPEARFRSNIGGTGPAPGTGLAGTGGLDVDASDTIDARLLFGLVA